MIIITFGKSCVSWYEKCYYYLEAWKLKHYERVLLYADKILAITNTDALYFTQKYPSVSTYCLPCFFDNISVETVTDVSPRMRSIYYIMEICLFLRMFE